MNWKFWNCLKSKKEIINEKDRFPCSSDNCLVRMSCTKLCEKIEMDNDKLKKLFIKYYKVCPDCGCTKFIESPSGGMTANVKCSGCGHWFHMGLPLFIQRIHMSDERFYE